MKRTKRLISTLLALCMVLAMLPANAMASGSQKTTWAHLTSGNGITVNQTTKVATLTQNVTLDGEPNQGVHCYYYFLDSETKNDHYVTDISKIDLNGHTLTLAAGVHIAVWYQTLTVTDSSTGTKGSVVAKDVKGGSIFDLGEDATLNLEGGITLKAESTGNDDFAVAVAGDRGQVLNVKNVTIEAQNGVTVNGFVPQDAGTKVTIDGAKFKTKDTAVYLAGPATTNVTNTNIVSESVGIEIRAGKLDVTDSTIQGGNQPTTVNPNGDGGTTSNAAIAVAQHTTNLPITVNIAQSTTLKATSALSVASPENLKAGAQKKADVAVAVDGATLNGDVRVDETAAAAATTTKPNNQAVPIILQHSSISGAIKFAAASGATVTNTTVTAVDNKKITVDTDGNVTKEEVMEDAIPESSDAGVTTPEFVTVTFKDGDKTYATRTILKNSKITNNWPADPTKADYTFDGWYANKRKYTKDDTFAQDITLTAQFKYSGATIGGDGRFTVLVLDESGSMYGTPSRNLKDAAKKFCAAVSADKGEIKNHLAIVGFSTGATVLHSFKEDPALIDKKIDQLYADGLTNIGDALQTAKGLLDEYATGKDVIKNIVLLSDGLPETNSKLPTGKYSSVDYPDYYFYGSANYCYKMAEDAKLVGENRDASYNVYTLGFFHSMSAKRAEFCKKVLRDLQSAPDGSQFYQITDVDQVQFVLSDYVLNDILKDDEIDSGTPAPTVADDRIVITIACPVDVKVMHNGKTILDSAPDANILKCDYGVMDVTPGENGTTKTVTLHAGYRYNLKLTATGEGKVDVSWARYAAGSSEPAASGSQSFPAVKVGDYIPVAVSKGNDADAPAVTVPETPVTSAPVKDEDIADSDAESHFAFVPAFDGGVVVLSRYDAKFGDWVNVYVTPDDGYELESLSITDQRGWPVVLREMGENVFSFTMPNARITVNAAFAKVEDDDPYSTVVPDTIPNVEGSSPNYGSMVINPAAMNYPDVNAGDWFYNNVKFCHERYLLNKTGEAEGKFEPNTAATRATVWTALSRLAGRNTMNQGDNWYDRAQVWAKNKGISDGERPLDSLTREEFVTMLWRYDGNKYVQNSALSQFSDGSSVSWWATEAVKWAVANGLLNGANGSLNPQSNVTRAEVAAILQRYIQNVH